MPDLAGAANLPAVHLVGLVLLGACAPTELPPPASPARHSATASVDPWLQSCRARSSVVSVGVTGPEPAIGAPNPGTPPPAAQPDSQPNPEGTLDEAAARRALRRGAVCIGNLYSRYLSLTRDRIVYTTRIVLKIGPRGRVRRVELAYGPSAAFGYAGIDCFCGISLPAPEGGSVTISVPIVLSPPASMRPLRP